ncbi:hypothetical protein [Phytoactinopolyspora mesophila]|uniref:Uncharacterized protein n=1 Tax=Phytoactinopolyspora mesophila TaxID=2650750 RepID=A0A7K3M6T5_9ACTN|nr:hypothetical protein [Phytoactinopolyspora mesophila]NDL58940.1 hypothetical protein [Phytoactinopolyspora mesophila]
MSDPHSQVPEIDVPVPDSPPAWDDGTLPSHGRISPPQFEIPESRPPDFPEVPTDHVSREELEIALERARLVADDCASILKPAIQAMHDGAWVSRRGDQFSLELEDHARVAADSAAGTVQVIQNALDQLIGTEPDVDEPTDPFVIVDPEFQIPEHCTPDLSSSPRTEV